MNPQQLLEIIEAKLPAWLPSQRWYSSTGNALVSARVVQHLVLRDAWPKLIWTLIETDDGVLYQVPIGVREAEHIGGILLGHDVAHIATVDVDSSSEEHATKIILYDALIDSVLGRVFFDVITDGVEEAKSMRSVGAEQSNTSLIFDNRYILKVFRRIYEGANPDLEVTAKLYENGFTHVAPITATWQRGNLDLAVCTTYLYDGTEGWKLTLASVRDFLAADTTGASATVGSPSVRLDQNDPGAAGGDLADEARRLGEMTGELHLAMAEAFGKSPFDPARLVKSLQSSIDEVIEEQRQGLQQLIDDLSKLSSGEAGFEIRIHGDYHLGQTLRSVSGWYVFDFEGEPQRPLDERVRPSSPLKDVSGMVRSFHYAALTGVKEQASEPSDRLQKNALAWEQRNRGAFEQGYWSVTGIEELLPSGEAEKLIYRGFEVEKAIYEQGYERAYRPDWVAIPQAALERLLCP